MSTTETNGKSAASRPRKRAKHKAITKWEAAKVAAQWVDLIRSTIAAVRESVDSTRHEAMTTPGTLGAVIDPDELRRLSNVLGDAESLAHCLQHDNPLDVVVPSALKMFAGEKGGVA